MTPHADSSPFRLWPFSFSAIFRPYRTLMRGRLKALLQYRAAAVAGAATQLFWGIVRVMIFTAFYRSTSAPQPISLSQTVTYLWLIQAMFALSMWNADPEVQAMIRTGTVAYELLRPLDLYWLWFTRSLASRLAPTALRCLPIFAVGLVFYGMRFPATRLDGLLFLFSIGLAFLLAAALGTLVTITLLSTTSAEGVTRLAPIAMYVGSGQLIPLPLLPEVLRIPLELLPFRGMVDTPFRIYLGGFSSAGAAGAMLHQLVWIAVSVGAGRVLLRRAAKRMVVQGG